MGSTLSIIVPTLDEEAELGATLDRAAASKETHAARRPGGGFDPVEILVVDASSQDSTAAIASARGARILSTPRIGRGPQMNAGAAQARGEVLWFLHADTWLAPGAIDALWGAMSDPGLAGGGFRRRFRGGSIFLRLTSALAGVRNRLWGWHLGDQAIFCRAEIFKRLGGYRSAPRFEDLDFSRRMGRLGRVATLGPPVMSSARRFARRGALRQTLLDLRLTSRYMRGLEDLPFDLNKAAPGD